MSRLSDLPIHQEGDRVIGLIDMDCFYVQVEQRQQPQTWGKPCAVIQYTGSSAIAVNYEARAFGVKRGFRVKQCRDVCPDIHLFKVPETNGKGDLAKYREASDEVFEIILNFNSKIVVERSSIDESFLDLTAACLDPDSREKYRDVDLSEVAVSGTKQSIDLSKGSSQNDDFSDPSIDPLIIGAKIIRKLRQEIKDKTQFTCSAGVSFNKFLSKIACTVRKPNGQSILSRDCVPNVFLELDITKVRNLGGKLGDELTTTFNVETMHDLSKIPLDTLKAVCGEKTGEWVYEMAKGNDNEVVSNRSINKSIGCGKNFPGLTSLVEVKKWIENISDELIKRLEQDMKANDRIAKGLVIHISFPSDFFSKTIPLRKYDGKAVADDVMKVIVVKLPKGSDRDSLQVKIVSMSLVAHKFTDIDKSTPRIQSFLIKSSPVNNAENGNEVMEVPEQSPLGVNGISTTTTHTSVPSTSTQNSNQVDESIDVQVIDKPETKTPSFTVHDQKGFFYRKTKELLLSKVVHL